MVSDGAKLMHRRKLYRTIPYTNEVATQLRPKRLPISLLGRMGFAA